jgi:hypothetical protein
MSRADSIVDLTPEQAMRAFYVDFEGQTDQPPILLGCTRRSGEDQLHRVRQVITDPAFAPLAQADGLELLSLGDAVLRILQRAEKGDRLIVAWTEHELNVVRTYCPEHLDRFRSRYVNARKLAVRWRNRRHAGDKPSGTLADYLTLVGYRVPDEAGIGMTGDTIAVLRRSLARDGDAEQLTDNQRRRWRDLREHNRHDCRGMRVVTLIAAREQAELRAPPRSLSGGNKIRASGPA